jgi:multidrug transporter EmrE-like cation transporter
MSSGCDHGRPAARLGWADRPDAWWPSAFRPGLYWALDHPGLPLLPLQRGAPLGQASAMVMPYDSQHNIFRWNHAFLLAHVRCWTDPGPDVPAYASRWQRQRATVPAKAQRIAPPEAASAPARALRPAPLRIRPQLARLHGHGADAHEPECQPQGRAPDDREHGVLHAERCLREALAEDLPLFQIVFLRRVLTTAILLTSAAAAMGQLRLRPGPGDRARLSWRTVFEIATMVAFLYALVNMPIANATAILAALPLSVTVGRGVFLGEPLGWRRMSAVLVGFVGVMLIVQPGTEGSTCGRCRRMLAVLFITGPGPRDPPNQGRACHRLAWRWSRQSAVGAVSLRAEPVPDLGARGPARAIFHRAAPRFSSSAATCSRSW